MRKSLGASFGAEAATFSLPEGNFGCIVSSSARLLVSLGKERYDR
jgi:hypothetical protein